MGRNAEMHQGAVGPDGSVQLDLEPVTAHVVAQYHNQHGGSSFHVHGGQRATSGYAVGGLQGLKESITNSPVLRPEEFQEHRDKVRTKVASQEAIAGTWVEGDQSVMDASERVPDRHTAKVLQIARGERAVYNLGRGQEEDLR